MGLLQGAPLFYGARNTLRPIPDAFEYQTGRYETVQLIWVDMSQSAIIPDLEGKALMMDGDITEVLSSFPDSCIGSYDMVYSRGNTMKITSRFTVAVHTLLCIHTFNPKFKTTSEFIASSVNVNPVIIRRTLGKLKSAGLVTVTRGTGGAELARDIDRITLLDVYRAVESIEGDMFNFHDNPNSLCPVGRNVHSVLDGHLQTAQRALEDSLSSTRLSELSGNLENLILQQDS